MVTGEIPVILTHKGELANSQTEEMKQSTAKQDRRQLRRVEHFVKVLGITFDSFFIELN